MALRRPRVKCLGPEGARGDGYGANPPRPADVGPPAHSKSSFDAPALDTFITETCSAGLELRLSHGRGRTAEGVAGRKLSKSSIDIFLRKAESKTIIIEMENICETRPVFAMTFDSEAREKGERENPCESLYATSDRNGDFFYLNRP
jgi:hypothetical protein